MALLMEAHVYPECTEEELRQLVAQTDPALWQSKDTSLVVLSDVFDNEEAARNYIADWNGSDLPLWACRFQYPVQGKQPDVTAQLDALDQEQTELERRYAELVEASDPDDINRRQGLFARIEEVQEERKALLEIEIEEPPVRTELRWLVGGVYSEG